MEIEEYIAPGFEKRQQLHQKMKEVSYYLIIGIISIIVMFVIPILTGCLYGDLSVAFPKTVEAWILWGLIKLGTAGSNVAIFVLFKQQAKVNIKDDKRYVEAASELIKSFSKTLRPRSPKEMNTKEYIVKGVTVFFTSLLASITIAALIISFDLVTFISCIISTIISIVFGWTTMLKNEVYWTEEFPLWVRMKTNKETSNDNN